MRTRDLLMVCVALVAGSILVVPGTVYAGLGRGLASELSSILLLAGILSAVLTVDSDRKETENYLKQMKK